MKCWLIFFLLCGTLIASCAGVEEENGRKLDRSTPEGTVQLLFDAITTQTWDSLPDFCDPNGRHDYDTRLLCAGGLDSTSRAETLKFFSKATRNGDFIEMGDSAVVPFLFGPDGTDPEEMELVRRDGKWYLLKF